LKIFQRKRQKPGQGFAELNKQKTQLTEDIEIAEQKSREESQNIYRVREESESLKRLVASNEGSIKTQTRENAIAELEAKQKDYWTMLEERLAYQMEQLAEGLEGFEEESKDPRRGH
jgi:Mg2+ and Co2+ transporter CorA